MKFPALGIVLFSFWLSLSSWLFAPPALALTPVKIFELDYQECPPELGKGGVMSGDLTPANCFIIFGKTENKSGKPVVDADVFGRIYDANGNSVMENRGRVGSIPEIPPGISDFAFRISVAANQPTPLKLEQFKATGFAGKVRKY
jgi:hypothetical protein